MLADTSVTDDPAAKALRRLRRWWAISGLVLFATALSVLILIDQHRLQPWAWQLLLMSCVFATRSANATRLLMLLTISVYFWSAVSKHRTVGNTGRVGDIPPVAGV